MPLQCAKPDLRIGNYPNNIQKFIKMQFIKISILKSYISDFSHNVLFVVEMKASIRNDMNVISDG